MKDILSTIETILEAEDRGVVLVSEKGDIKLYTKVAKKISGLILKTNQKHPAGKIQDGDIVVILDNELENDDFLTPEDFKAINIHDSNIKKGDSIIAIGVYNNEKAEPIYKYERTNNPSGKLELKADYHGLDIDCCIDYDKHNHEVIFNGEKYEMGYYRAVGFSLIIDGTTGNVKFFQAQGCGIRDEETGKILRGKEWLPKIGDEASGKLVNWEKLTMDEVFAEKEISGRVMSLMNYEHGYTEKGIYMIYNKPAYCQFVRVKNDGPYDGVCVVLQDVLNLDGIRREKMDVIGLLEEKQRVQASSDQKESLYSVDGLGNVIGISKSMRELKLLAYKASKAKFNVLITGESGTGKSMLAREIHKLWNSKAPFVEVNCNAIATSLFESELFGYEAGAFTGASEKGKKGYFEEANGGTLFLDEIGDIPLEVQVKLLQALEDKKIYRVGSTKPIDIDVRIITATNQDLLKAVNEGKFRKDLYYRINVYPIAVPAIRERVDDLFILANSLLNDICSEHRIDSKLLSDEAMKKILSYSWPGNVRELENVLERAVVLCDSSVIYSENIRLEQSGEIGNLKEQLNKAEKTIINESFIRNKGDKKKIMKELDISQSSLYEKLARYGIEE